MTRLRWVSRLLAATALLAVVFSGCGGPEGGGPPSATAGTGGSSGGGGTGADSGVGGCGDGMCDATETCTSCAVDCGTCSAACGNGMCEQNESCASCADDCGSCTCGNGKCDDDESCADCATDCGACPPNCGDGSCDPGDYEDCEACSTDCGACPTVCGDGLCNADTEGCSSCPVDCGDCPTPGCGDGNCGSGEDCDICPDDCGNCVCGNGKCDGIEDCADCPGDCGACVCGNTACEPYEDCSTCPADCGACAAPTCGDGQCDTGESCSTCVEDCRPCVNYDPGKLVVYTINYENLATKSPKECGGASPDAALCTECKGEWPELIAEIEKRHIAPDVMLIQQIDGKGVPRGIQKVTAKLAELFPGETYKSIVAEKDPAAWSGANCVAKTHQTNGIIFRGKRLLYVSGTKKTLMAKKTTSNGCADGKLSRNIGVFGKFADLMHGKNGSGGYKREVAIASIHWPVEDGCGVTNANLTDDLLLSYTGAQMYLWGGDVNLKDSNDNVAPMPWYRRANAELADPDNRGYRDPIWRACGGQFGACIAQNFTFNEKQRIDFLFVKYASKYKSALPMTSDEATIDGDPSGNGVHYSQHESVTAHVHW